MKNLTSPCSSALTLAQFVRVRFPSGSSVVGGETDFYFGSLSAAFEMFSEEELGVGLQALYALKLVADGVPFLSSTGVEFKKLKMYRKKQKNS